MILFVLLAVLAQKRATIALRHRKIKLDVLQPMSVSDQEQENSPAQNQWLALWLD
jgi:hypothetical protein